MPLRRVLAQVDPTSLADPSLWSQFGPFSIVFIVMTTLGGGIILWLLRDRAKTATSHAAELLAVKTEWAADVKAHREQLDIERKATRDLGDRLIQSAERTAPLLERAAVALEHASAR